MAKTLAAIAILIGGLTGCGRDCCKPDPTACYQIQARDLTEETEKLLASKVGRPPRGLEILVLSGGGANGAWGAGFLNGWSQRAGGRPKFDVVTGVSTGALMATAALLGEDKLLEDAYTKTTRNQVYKDRWAIQVPFSNSLKDSSPLHRQIEGYLPNPTIDLVAAEWRAGRRLYVASADLDSGNLAIWDLGKIAAAGEYDLYRDAIYASASVPVLFPPVGIGGHLHADGGTRAMMFLRDFLLPALTKDENKAAKAADAAIRASNVYVIINGATKIEPSCPPNWIGSIAMRSLALLTESHSLADVYVTYYYSQLADARFKLSYIPEGVKPVDSFAFVTKDMARLYDEARAYGRKAVWQETPPLPDRMQLKALRK